MILLGAAAWRLHALSQVSATARFVDYWLLYIAVMGTLHGGGMGALAGLVASAAHIAFWAETERELIFFLYNVDNWLVPAGYLLSGALFGYVRDSQRERLDALKREKDGRDSELKLAKAMYTEANEDRSRLLEQVLRYRDSYGRIYRITCELDAMLPQQIFLSALGIVEEMMQCRSVAIYARSGDLPFARLAVSSREAEPLPRSLDLGRMPALRNALDRGELFANTDLKPGYPAFASPIRDGEEMLAMIALWDVPFDRQTLYYENLLNVVSGLVQSALRRAVRYFNLSGDMYLEDTRILTDRAFRCARVYQAVRKRQSGDFLLARLRGAWPMSAEEIDRRTGGAIRSVDLIGAERRRVLRAVPQRRRGDAAVAAARAEGLRLRDCPGRWPCLTCCGSGNRAAQLAAAGGVPRWPARSARSALRSPFGCFSPRSAGGGASCCSSPVRPNIRPDAKARGRRAASRRLKRRRVRYRRGGADLNDPKRRARR